eukprot:gnl/TRDRNA2_/TRDRNA2_174237_c0_seq2.p1 gnl/TRDRNA2_/TRDRNA2_174237_c0~~gnl/TRDRNA2_/TRDRNA2_174237_c0_seq2.p1  ORF type:complete len:578 (+),score=89.37 gnl/TRDRNA2_/TRDRNA2_174237_c0_seq2:87-1820(+)
MGACASICIATGVESTSHAKLRSAPETLDADEDAKLVAASEKFNNAEVKHKAYHARNLLMDDDKQHFFRFVKAFRPDLNEGHLDNLWQMVGKQQNLAITFEAWEGIFSDTFGRLGALISPCEQVQCQCQSVSVPLPVSGQGISSKCEQAQFPCPKAQGKSEATEVIAEASSPPAAAPEALSPDELCMSEREAILMSGKELGGEAGARFVHEKLPPVYWGVSRLQVRSFTDDVRIATNLGLISNSTPSHLPQYPESHFVRYGPNMHQVNSSFIKPCTNQNSLAIPFASFALMLNHIAGRRCDLFISHAWDEGVYEFGASVDKHWPEECEGAYICFLSNPQNLNISELVGTPRDSPFYRVLRARPFNMLMVANSNTPIHSRLWCVYEAHCAMTMQISVKVVGNLLCLVAEGKREEVSQALVQWQKAKVRSLEAGSSVEVDDSRFQECLLGIPLDVSDAKCSSNDDATRIWSEIRGSEAEINDMIKEQMSRAAFDIAENLHCSEVVGRMRGAISRHGMPGSKMFVALSGGAEHMNWEVFGKMCMAFDPMLSQKDMLVLWTAADTNNDQKISHDEFVSLFS